MTENGLRAGFARDLIFDVGLHLGEDTAYYLKKGYRVVAFEANPDLVDTVSKRFAQEIEENRLRVVWGAVTSNPRSEVTFFRHPSKSVWGTVDEEWVERNAGRGESAATEVPGVDFAQALSTYGVPWYMKIDIEGADRHCLETLLSFEERPAFVSIESEKREWSKLVEEIDLLTQLGYDRFAVRQQEGLHRARRPHQSIDLRGGWIEHRFEEHSSGAFGEDVKGWMTREKALETYRRIFRRYNLLGDHSALQRVPGGFVLLKAVSRLSGVPLPGWYDTHAAKRSAANG
jgi:FkbM family methyltransferase